MPRWRSRRIHRCGDRGTSRGEDSPHRALWFPWRNGYHRLVTPVSVFAKDNNLVIGGIPWEFVQRLESMGGAFIEWPKANIDFDIKLYKLCCQRMVLAAGAAAAQSIAEGRNVQDIDVETLVGTVRKLGAIIQEYSRGI